MNRIAFIAVVATLGVFLTACNQDKIKQLEQQNAELLNSKRVQDSVINDFVGTFNAFQENLDMIKEKENLITMSSGNPESATSSKEQIISDIQTINSLLDQNRQIIDELTRKAQSSESRAAELNRLVARLKKQVEERDAEINSLKQQLVALNFSLDSLNVRVSNLARANEELNRTTIAQSEQIASQNQQIASQNQTLQKQDEDLNAVYYIVGSAKELKNLGVLDRRKLDSDFDDSAFTRVDKRNVTSIPINAKRVKLISSHPSGTYELKEVDKMIESLEISNPAGFWRNTKHLVIQLD